MTAIETPPVEPPARRRLGPLPAGVFSVALATALMTVALVVGWYVPAGIVIGLAVLLDRRPLEWQAFAAAGGLLAVCAVVAQAQRHDTAMVAFLLGSGLCGFASTLFNRPVRGTGQENPPDGPGVG